MLLIPFRSLVKCGADADYAGHPYTGESSIFGQFDGCTFTPEPVYYTSEGAGGADSYPPDKPGECSPNCYMQTPESIRGKGAVSFL